MLLALVRNAAIGSVGLTLALVQFPIYSLLISREQSWWKGLLLVHGLAAMLAISRTSDIF
jgi:hypothetical protein